VVGTDGKKYAFRHVPVAAVVHPRALLLLAAGSEVDYGVLDEEVAQAADFGVSDRLFVDSQATVLKANYAEEEAGIITGTTGKGIGAARADRLMRKATLTGMLPFNARKGDIDTAKMMRNFLREGGTVQIEGTQGYGLGLHAGYYPYCTSSDCRAIDFMAMAGISPWDNVVTELEIWIVLRAHPIRIAGNSGPMFCETTWESLGQKPEITTVTKKIRRVGQWDSELAIAALRGNGYRKGTGNVSLAFTFLDYMDSSMHGVSGNWSNMTKRAASVLEITAESIGVPGFQLAGTGPDSMLDLR
jgi:adenylosuccinate synthase